MARWRDIKKGNIESKKEKSSQEKQNEVCYCDAPLMSRFKAFVTDVFMLLMPIMYLVFYVVMGSREEFAQDKMHGWLYILIPNMIAVLGFWYYKAQTPGMKAYEIILVDKTTGEKPSLIAMINRYVFTFFTIMIPALWLVPFLNKKKKTLQDFISGTCMKHHPSSL